MKKAVLIIFVTINICKSNTYAQNPLPRLKSYYYLMDNRIDLEDQFSDSMDDFSCTNVYLDYYKNPLYAQTFSPDQIMLFKINYEHLIQMKVDSLVSENIAIPFAKEDKITLQRIYTIESKKGSVKEKRLRKKYYNTSISDSNAVFTINNEKLESNTVLRIKCIIESDNFRSLYLSPLPSFSENNYVFLSMPKFFNYDLNTDNLKLISYSNNQMILKQFSHDVSRLTEDKKVENLIYKWSRINDEKGIHLQLNSINLPVGIGTSVEEILQN